MNTLPPQDKPIDFNRELQANCTLGYIDLSSSYIKTVIHSASLDPDFSIDDTQRAPYFQAKTVPVSDNLRKAKSCGYIPSVNSDIGATFDTFCIGAIEPNTTHPLLKLIQGPNYSVNWITEVFFSDSQNNYSQPLSVASVSDLENALSSLAPTPQVFNALTPALENIPDYETLLTPNTTYNIWQLSPIYSGQVQNNDQDIQLYRGYIPTNSNEPTMWTKYPSSSSGQSAILRVRSKNAACQISRLYPISNDLVYKNYNPNVKLWWNPPHTTILEYANIQAEGNVNCGFVLKFTEISGSDLIAAGINSSSSSSNNTYVFSKIGISWGNTTDYTQFINSTGDSTEYTPNVFENYYLEIGDLGFSLKGNGIELIKLNKQYKIGSLKELKLYVHYAGLVMYVGFDENPETWIAVKEYPIPGNDQGQNQFIYHKMDATANISINVMNVDFNFQYGAICFNNHDKAGYQYSIVKNSTGISTIVPSSSYPYNTYPYLLGKPFYTARYLLEGTVVTDDTGAQSVQLDPVTANLYSESSINETILKNVIYLSDYVDISSTYNQGVFVIDFFNSIPYHINDTPTGTQEFNSIGGTLYWDYRLTTNPIQYVQQSQIPIQANPGIPGNDFILNGYVQIEGQVFYTNTIEGPIMLRMGSVSTDAFENNDRPVTGFINSLPWGDLTDYFQSTDITATINQGTLSHRLEKEASIVLKNLYTSPLGASILYLIKNNLLTITIQAGYKNNLSTFFEGVIYEVDTADVSSTGTVIVKAKDVLTTLISRPTGFQFPNAMLFRGMEYGKIIKTTFGAVGLDDYLWINIQDQDVLDAARYRLPFVSDTAENKLSAIAVNKSQYLVDVIDTALNLIVTQTTIASNVDTGQARQALNIPVLFWDNTGITTSTFGVISLQQRGASNDPTNHKLNNTNLEILQFVASQDGMLPNLDAINFIGTTLDVGSSGIHGLLANSTFRTSNQLTALSAGMRLVGQKPDSSYFVRYCFDPNAFDTESIVEGPYSSQFNAGLITGYVGYNKMLINDPTDVSFKFLDQRLLTDEQLVSNLENYLFNQVRNVIETLSFEVYVTKPLREHGKFKIEFFSNDANFNNYQSDEFFYKSVKYTINKDKSTIIASVEGANLSYLAGLGANLSGDVFTDLDLQEYKMSIMKYTQSLNDVLK